MNTPYIRFCVSLFGVIAMAMLAGATIASNEGSALLWLAAAFSICSVISGALYLTDRYRSAMLATEKAYAQIERLERQLD